MSVLSFIASIVAAITGVILVYISFQKPYFSEFQAKMTYSLKGRINFTICTSLLNCHIEAIQLKDLKIVRVASGQLIIPDYSPEGLKDTYYSDFVTSPSKLQETFTFGVFPSIPGTWPLESELVVFIKFGMFRWRMVKRIKW